MILEHRCCGPHLKTKGGRKGETGVGEREVESGMSVERRERGGDWME